MTQDLAGSLQAAAQPKQPLTRQVIVVDLDKTLLFDLATINQTLARFIALSVEKGHQAFVVTDPASAFTSDLALTVIELTLERSRRAGLGDFSQVRSCFKPDLKRILREEGIEQVLVTFENRVEQLQGPNAYVSSVFQEEVLGISMTTNIENMQDYARLLGFGPEFEAYLQQISTLSAPAPNPPK